MDWYGDEEEGAKRTNGATQKPRVRIFQGARNGVSFPNPGKRWELKQNRKRKCLLDLARGVTADIGEMLSLKMWVEDRESIDNSFQGSVV